MRSLILTLLVTVALIHPVPADETTTETFPPVKLRGYGMISGAYTADAAGGSILRITCQDVEHARIVQAKYLSDLEELPPGTKPGQIDVAGTKISIRNAEDVGALAVLRHDTTVVVVTGKSSETLSQSIPTAVTGDLASWTSEAEGQVPMFMDRFDKYGFRFYYQPQFNKRGPDGKEMPDYDPTECFEFAQSLHHVGLVIWQEGQESETGEGMNQEPAWDWALKKARQLELPVGINLAISSRAHNWYYNRHPETLFQYAPQYGGGHYRNMNYNEGPTIAWSSFAGQDALLADFQVSVRRLMGFDNITSWLEPHGEIGHGLADVLVDTGPGADANYQDYLRTKYKTIEALSQRWYGNKTALTSWKKVQVPEPAYFLGWSPDAIDLAGQWRLSYDQANNPDALASEFADSTWTEIASEGPKPAVYRRHINVPSEWLAKNPQPWIYVWDLNDTRGGRKNPSETVVVAVNGKTLPETPLVCQEGHWTALNVQDSLHAGDNVIAIHLTRGRFNYRVYFSGEEPKSYPDLGPGRNAQWVDFTDWSSYIRAYAVRRGMQMIRQVDSQRGIVLMSPYNFENDILQAAIDYGGDFHDTGSMGGWWNDRAPAIMRGAGLPISVEPGNGPSKPVEMQIGFGNWITEGVNAIDFFQNMGEVLWHPEIKQAFEEHQALYTSIGRYHAPAAQVAAFTSSWVPTLFGFPWDYRPAAKDGLPYFRGGGYPSTFNSRSLFSLVEHVPGPVAYDSDAVNENMFTHNQVGKYRVIVDSNTSVITSETIDGIERYVRAGGVFVTYGETGRHSPEIPDSWPIDRLTGFHTTDSGTVRGPVALADKQNVFAPDTAPSGDLPGHHFAPVAPDTQTLMTWNDGTTAVGLRPLGKGFVVTVGPWFNQEQGNAFFSHLFQWLKIDPIPARVETSGPEILWRHFLTNNGLYDVWVVRNGLSKEETATGTLVLSDGLRPPWFVDLKTSQRSPLTDGRLPVNLPPHEIAIYLTPRTAIAQTSAEWLTLQRGWWQGTADPGPPLPPLEMKLAVDLTDNWAFQPVDAEHADILTLVNPTTDDHAWPRIRLGIFSYPDYPDVKHAVLRRQIHVPEKWNKGRVLLRLPASHGKAYLDGKEITADTPLAAGSNHLLALDIEGKSVRVGANGCAWLTYHPDPVTRQDLAGPWEVANDKSWSGTLTLPGTATKDVLALRKTVRIDPAQAAGKTIIFHLMQTSNEMSGVVTVNGHSVGNRILRESYELNANITPWVKLGQNNVIELSTRYGRVATTEVTLEFHEKGTYP